MNAPTNMLVPARKPRSDGWTGDRQRAFLEAVSEGHTVERACRLVGLSVSSAYQFRRRAPGSGFALGWDAATLLARPVVADTLMARAIDGQTETITRPDGSVYSRHRYDNGLGTRLLARLDAQADAQHAAGTHHAARMIAGDWEAYLDLIERDDGPARAGLFVGLRAANALDHPELTDVIALARADRYIRTGASLAGEVVIDDLDPARRGEWTADQWARADAAGLLNFTGERNAAEPEDTEDNCAAPERVDPCPPVWWNDEEQGWRTDFPPPKGFTGFEDADYDADNYARELSEDELATILARYPVPPEPHADAAADRDRWFAALADGRDLLDLDRLLPPRDPAAAPAAPDPGLADADAATEALPDTPDPAPSGSAGDVSADGTSPAPDEIAGNPLPLRDNLTLSCTT